MQNRDHKLINLETFVNEKLKVTKPKTITKTIPAPDLIALLESKDRNEFNSRCKQLIEYLKKDSNLPIAELEVRETGFKQLLREYKNGNDTFLWVLPECISCGTWDDRYFIYWSQRKRGVSIERNSIGFNELICNADDIDLSGGIFIITDNDDLVDQIDYLIQKT